MSTTYHPVPQQQMYKSPTLVEADMNDPFAHLSNVPLWPIYSESEVEVIRKALETNAETKKLRQDIAKNMEPQPDALTAKVVHGFISLMSDGGTTLVLKQFNPDKLMLGTTSMVDAMEQRMMQDNTYLTYSRWATQRDFPGPPVIVDVLTWHSFSDHAKIRGVQVKANTAAKIKVFDQLDFSVKEGKEWKKTFFRGRYWTLSVSVTGDGGAELELGKVLSIERGVSPNISPDLSKRWTKWAVPKV